MTRATRRRSGGGRNFRDLSLRTQLVSLLLVTASFVGMGVGLWYALREERFVLEALTTRADVLVANLAVSATSDLLASDFASLEHLLGEYVRMPGVVRARAFDAEGASLGQVVKEDGAVRPAYGPTSFPTSFLDGAHVASVPGATGLDAQELDAWAEVTVGPLILGYVNLGVSLADAALARQRAIVASVVPVLAIPTSILLVLLLFLRRPMGALQDASYFARHLDHMQGMQLSVEPSAREFTALGRALNEVSLRLRDQEDALRASEAWSSKLALVASRTNNAVVITDPHVRIEWVNAGFTRLTGYTLDEVRGRNPGHFLQGPDTDRDVVRRIAESVRGKLEFHAELVNYAKDGRKYWVEIEGQPVLDERGTVTQYIAIETDITERKAAAAELAQQHEFATTVMNTVAQGITVTGPDWRFDYVNPAFAQIAGVEQDQLIGLSPMAFGDPLSADILERVKQERLEGRSSTYEMRIRRRDGSFVDVQVTGVPRWRDGTFLGTISVVSDVTERKQQMAELEGAKESAERANHAKSEFLSRMSHELRTPLNAILGFAQLLSLDELSTDQLDSVARITMAGKHLLSLINEVLELSRIEVAGLGIELAPVTVCAVVDDVIGLVRPIASARQVEVRYSDDVAAKHVLADAQRLKQVLLNLLSNGIKYNRPGGSVTVSCARPDASTVRLVVRDTGIGVPEEKVDRLFVPFDRLDIEQRSAEEGAGIGLALTRRLVEAMGGRIGVESTVGQGSAFWVDLPSVERPDGADDGAAAAVPHAGEEARLAHDRPLRIAYVEDNLANLELVRKAVSRHHGVEIVSAMTGQLGLDLIRSSRPDVVLLDLHLPGMSGENILDALEADPATRDYPVVVVSADATRARIESLEGRPNVVRYFSKPIDVVELMQVVREVAQRVAGPVGATEPAERRPSASAELPT